MLYDVSSGQVSSGITLNGFDYMYVYYSGTANSTTVNSRGDLSVSSGGTANSTTVNSNGYLYVSSGGTAIDTTVNSGGRLYVSSRGTANSTTVNSGGWMIVYDGGMANSTTVNSGGFIYVSSGGAATNIAASSGAGLKITVASNTYIQGTSAGSTFEMKDAFLSGYTVNSGSYLIVSSGGTANSTTLNYGFLYVFSGGTANSTTVNSGGYMYVSSGGTATDIVWTPCVGMVTVLDGGYATFVSNYSGVYFGSAEQLLSSAAVMNDKTINGNMYVFSGGTVNNTTVNSGYLYVHSGGTANSTTVNSSGSMGVFSGGTTNSTAVNSGGYLLIYNGGSATAITAEVGARLVLTVAADTYIQGTSAGTAFLMKNALMSGYTVNSGGILRVSSGGTADSTTVNDGDLVVFNGGTTINTAVNSGGRVYVDSGGTANSTTLNYGFFLHVFSGGTANSTTVNSSGSMGVFSGGTTNSTAVNSGGWMSVSSGGTATDIVWTPCVGMVTVLDGGYATFVSNYSGVYFGSAEQLLSNAAVMNDKTVTGNMYVFTGGTANYTTVNHRGVVHVSSGGTANSTTLNYGFLYVFSGGTANSTTVNSGGTMRVHSGGTADSTTITSGDMNVSSGGTANNTTVNSKGWILVRVGGTANYTTVNSGGYLYVSSAGVANYTTVDSDGRLRVYDGGTANGTTVNDGGGLAVYDGGTANSATVNDGGWLAVDYGGKIRGSLQIASGGSVDCNTGSILDFDISGRTANSSALVNNLSLIHGAPDYTITVSASQAAGAYTLAGGASGISGTFSIGTDGANYGTVTVNGSALAHGQQTFTLATSGNSLLLTVTGEGAAELPKVLSVTADITAATDQNVTVTATFNGTAVSRQYSLNNTTSWEAYTSGVVMTANGTVYFRGIDSEGNVSEVVSYAVTNINKTTPDTPDIPDVPDTIPPPAPAASASTTAPTSGKVTVTAAFSEDTAQKQYSLDGKNWQAYTTGVEMSANGTVYFRGIDAAGNISDVTSYTVANIVSDDHEFSGDNTAKYQISLNNSGKYTLSGNFGDITGTITVLNGGKKAGTGNIKNGVLTFNKGNPILLDSSLVTEVEVKIKKGTDTKYSVSLNPQSLFTPNDGDSQSSPRQLGKVVSSGPLVNDGWVGYGDESDYLAFTLDHAASLSLDLTSTDAAKFTLINAATGKTVLSSSLKAGAALTTKAKLLEAGQYYLQVKSTNAKKGGDASYTVSVNPGTAFFTQGGDNNDSWQTAEAVGDLQVGAKVGSGWVGFGDVYDFKSVTLNTAARLKFTVDSSDAVKFTVYQLNNGKLKSLGNVSVKANATGTTKDIFVTAGTYYLSVQSTNAKKGGNADYSITLDGSSKIFPAGDNTNDTWQAASQKTAKLQGEEITGWVGFGDAKDFIRFQLNGDGQIQLDLNSVTADAWSAKQIKLTCLDAKGKSVALSALDSDTLVSKKAVAAGEYYLGVTCANVKKFDTSYSVTTGLLATA